VTGHRAAPVGIRLEGPPLQRHESRLGQEMLSEGVVHGSIQVPFGSDADHKVLRRLHHASLDPLVTRTAQGSCCGEQMTGTPCDRRATIGHLSLASSGL